MKKVTQILTALLLAVFAVPAMAQTTQTEDDIKANGLIPYENLNLDGYKTNQNLMFGEIKEGGILGIIGATLVAYNVKNNGGSKDKLGTNKYCGDIEIPASHNGKDVTTLAKSYANDYSAGTFQGSYIKTCKLPATITTIDQATFADCPYLTDIIVDPANSTYFDYNGVLYKRNGDGTYTLVAVPGACEREQITILEGTTAIANCAFDGCFRIKEVTIPATVATIGIYAFTGSGVETITCLNPAPPQVDGSTSGIIQDHGFIKMLKDHKDITVNVPAESVNEYKDHDDWSDFSVQAIATPGVDQTTFKVAMTLVETKNTKGEVTAVKEIHVYGANNEALAALPTEWTLTYEGTVYSIANNNMTVTWDKANSIVCLTFGDAAMNAEGEYKLNIPAGSLKTSDDKECLEANFYYIIQAPEVVQKELLHAVILNITDSDDEYSWKYTNSNGETVANATKHTIGSTLYTEETRYTDVTENVTTITNHIYYSAEVQYARTFKNTEWQPLFVPFAMDYKDWSDQFEIAEITGIIENGFDSAIEFYVIGTVLESGAKTEANTPYLIRAKSSNADIAKKLQIGKEKTLSSATDGIVKSIPSTKNAGYTYNFVGQYTAARGTTGTNPKIAYNPGENKDEYNFVMTGGVLKHPDDTNGAKLGAFRWYLSITKNDAKAKSATFSFGNFSNDGTTGIEEVTTENVTVNGIYDLSGRKLDAVTEPGVYIIDGKKVLVK